MENTIKEKYNKVLNQLKLTYIDEAEEFINTRKYQSIRQEKYYKNVFYQYKDKTSFEIISIDKNNRIHTILSRTPRYLRSFLNIKYSLDISNSHPLLLNYYLIKKYEINENQLNYLYKIIDDYKINSFNKIYSYNNYVISPYDNENFYKSLKINIQKISKNANKIPTNVIEYMVKTSLGKFWEDFTTEFKGSGLLRDEVKTTLFKEVFYSKTTNTRYKGFAKAFKKKYKNVYDLINVYKPKEDTKLLSNMMMGLEAEIFHQILEKLYKKRGCNVLTIHDAIVMLDTKGTEKYQPDEIEKVMKQVYHKYNLNPSISIEYFTPDKWKKEIEELQLNQPYIDAYIEELRNYASNPNDENYKSAKGILKWIEDGEVEIIVENGVLVFHTISK
ncbi:hypothetical protein D0T84_22245 [Dysgonomonas sp. 521]|uniref:hypothetical protein n=1 Tax=Dysgonomonas sp. 521 TaxID=2302932 RepID=UPI0013D1DBE9|nr:hypothetical protein [Dysgonomonas sp. 521]NDV97582.1 hypothetical protein [Dysgonomonas sp. 521]